MATVIALCSILALIIFSVQLALCYHARKTAVKGIPVFLIAAAYSIALLFYIVDIFNGRGGVAIWAIFAFLIAIADTVALISDIAAWALYKLLQKRTPYRPKKGR